MAISYQTEYPLAFAIFQSFRAAFLSTTYGWDFYKNLRAGGAVASGGNSSVMRRIEGKEFPLGIVLLDLVSVHLDGLFGTELALVNDLCVFACPIVEAPQTCYNVFVALWESH